MNVCLLEIYIYFDLVQLKCFIVQRYLGTFFMGHPVYTHPLECFKLQLIFGFEQLSFDYIKISLTALIKCMLTVVMAVTGYSGKSIHGTHSCLVGNGTGHIFTARSSYASAVLGI